MEAFQKVLIQGMWVRPDVLKFVQNKTITVTESFCLIYMDEIIRSSGAFFSYNNAWLENRLGVSNRKITEILSKLKDLGLIKLVKFSGGKRQYVTYFQVQDKRKLGRKTPSSKKHGFHWEPRRFCGASIIYNNIYISFLSNNKKITYVRRSADSATLFPSKELKGTKSGQKKSHPRWKKYANQLASLVQEVWNYPINSVGWYKSLEKLQSQKHLPIPRIKSVLDWYCRAMRNSSEEEREFIPVVKSARQFLGKFLSLEDAMKRQKRKEKKGKHTPGGPIPIVIRSVKNKRSRKKK
jgi:hypothetical protein